MTVGALAESDAARRRSPEVPAWRPPVPVDCSDELDDIGELKFLSVCNEWWDRGVEYTRPRRNRGASNVTPNSGCLQNGHEAGSETSNPSVSISGFSEGGGGGAVGSACSGGWGSGLLICTKHSEHIAWSQHLVRFKYGG